MRIGYNGHKLSSDKMNDLQKVIQEKWIYGASEMKINVTKGGKL